MLTRGLPTLAVPATGSERPALAGTRARIGAAVAATVALLAATWAAFPPFYETNDDAGMRLILEGRFAPGASPQGLLLFINALLGGVLASAQRLLPAWPWYDTMLTGGLALATALLLFVLWRRPTPRRALVVGVFSLAILGESVVAMQFTRVAALLAGAALLLVVDGALTPPPTVASRWTTALVAVFAMAWAAMIRVDATALAAGLVAALVLPLARRHGGWRRWRGPGVAFAVCAGVPLIFSRADEALYSRQAGWEHFRAYNRQRSALTELRSASQGEALAAARAAASWSDNDLAMLNGWFFSNRQVFAPARMLAAHRALVAANEGSPRPLAPVAWREGLYGVVWEGRLALAFLLGLAVLSPDWRFRLFVAYVAVATTAVLVGIHLGVKAVPSRLSWPLWTIAAALVTRLLDEGELKRRSLRAAVALLFLCGLVVHALLGLRAAVAARAERSARLERDLDSLPPGLFHVVVGAAFPREVFVRPWRPTPPPERFRFIALGAAAQTPLVQDFVGREGVEDLALDLCRRPDWRLVTAAPLVPVVVRFVGEHFAWPARLDPTFVGETFTSYRCARHPESRPRKISARSRPLGIGDRTPGTASAGGSCASVS
jgi:hypothetical protein